jgi:hypothetical protein
MKHVDVICPSKSENCRPSRSEIERDLDELMVLKNQLAIHSGALAIPVVGEKWKEPRVAHCEPYG